MHGDVAVVELLPRSEWRGKATALAVGQGEASDSKPIPTGQFPPRTISSHTFSSHTTCNASKRRGEDVLIEELFCDTPQFPCLCTQASGIITII